MRNTLLLTLVLAACSPPLAPTRTTSAYARHAPLDTTPQPDTGTTDGILACTFRPESSLVTWNGVTGYEVTESCH